MPALGLGRAGGVYGLGAYPGLRDVPGGGRRPELCHMLVSSVMLWQAVEERDDLLGERIVHVAGDHVRGAMYVDIPGVRDLGHELPGYFG